MRRASHGRTASAGAAEREPGATSDMISETIQTPRPLPAPGLRAVDAVADVLVAVCLAIACLVALFIAVFGTVDVVSTYFFARPIPLGRELPEELMVLLIFMALPKVVRMDRNVAVDLFVEHAPPKLQLASRLFALALGTGVFGFLALQSFEGAADSFAVREAASAAIRFPIYPIKALMCLALAVTALESLRLFVGAVRVALTGSGEGGR